MSVPGFGSLSAKQIATRFAKESLAEGITTLAAGLAYYAMLAVFPFLIFLVSLLGFVPVHGLADDLIRYIHRVAPGDAASVLTQTIRNVTNSKHPAVLVISIVGAILSAASGVMSMMTALDRMADIPPERSQPLWKQGLVALGITLVLAITCIVTLVLLAIGGDLFSLLFGHSQVAKVLWQILRWPIAVAIDLAALAFVLWASPSIRPRFQWVSPGTVVTVPLWFGLTIAFGEYVRHIGSYSRQYGPFASVIVLLVWFYLSALALLAGAKLTALAAEAHGEEPPPKDFAERSAPVRVSRPPEPQPA